MSFLKDDEYIILMNLGTHQLQGTPVLSLDNRKSIRDAGVRTAIEYPEWVDIEPAQGVYNFSAIDRILEINRAAGMKTILSLFNPWMPNWIPDTWKPKYQNGIHNTAFISIWNEEGVQYKLDHVSMLINKYTSDDVMFIIGDVDTGESMLPSYAWYDDNAINSFGGIPNFDSEDTKVWLEKSAIEYYVKMQRVLYPQHKEIWDAHQWLIAQKNPASVNYAQPKLLETYRKEFSDLTLVLLQYTYFDDSHPQENTEYVDRLKNDYDLDVIVEAMFCKGFPVTAPKAIAKGFRGQIVCPTHPHTHEQSFHGWMTNSIRDAHNLWSKK